MTILNFPAITPNSSDWGLQANTQSARSELDGSVQTLALPGDVWVATLTFANKFEPEARVLRAFLASLRGQAGRFYISPPGYTRAGSGVGSPVIAGAGQSGSTLTTTGWTPSQTGVLLVGDYFQIGDELKMITADVNSDSSGDATLNFVPPLRNTPTFAPSGSFGSEILPAGFGTGAWHTSSSWSVVAGVATGPAYTTGSLYSDSFIEAGKFYTITYVLTRASGSVRFTLEGDLRSGPERAVSGTYTETIYADYSGSLYFFGNAFAGSLTITSLKENIATAAPIVVDSPKCIMMLKDGNQARWQAQPTPIYAMSMAVQEAFL